MSEEAIMRAMEEMPYGVYIIGSKMDGEVNGMLAEWVVQVSFSPRLVAVSLENDARTLENVQASKVFTVNLLSQESMDLASQFAQPYYGRKIHGRTAVGAGEVHHKLAGIPHNLTRRGCPVLEASMVWFECEVEQFLPVGDHTLVIGRVTEGQAQREGEPLTKMYTGWTYCG